jgi:hypothetical protein
VCLTSTTIYTSILVRASWKKSHNGTRSRATRSATWRRSRRLRLSPDPLFWSLRGTTDRSRQRCDLNRTQEAVESFGIQPNIPHQQFPYFFFSFIALWLSSGGSLQATRHNIPDTCTIMRGYLQFAYATRSKDPYVPASHCPETATLS